jgi:hypothetical protein
MPNELAAPGFKWRSTYPIKMGQPDRLRIAQSIVRGTRTYVHCKFNRRKAKKYDFVSSSRAPHSHCLDAALRFAT